MNKEKSNLANETHALSKGAVSGSLPLTLKPVKKLKRGDVFLWKSGMTGRYEIHTFHSDSGYGAKTFTSYNDKDGSSEVVNYSGICGVLLGNDR